MKTSIPSIALLLGITAAVGCKNPELKGDVSKAALPIVGTKPVKIDPATNPATVVTMEETKKGKAGNGAGPNQVQPAPGAGKGNPKLFGAPKLELPQVRLDGSDAGEEEEATPDLPSEVLRGDKARQLSINTALVL